MKTIELKNVSKIYNNKVTAMDNVSLKLSEGEFIAVMGQSGSGKSTLLQIAGLLDSCTSGEVIINGENVSKLDKNKLADVRMKSLGFVFQAFHLNSHLKVYENIMVPMLINSEFKNKAEMKQRAEELVATVGLLHRIDHYPSELSGGEQQRVAIARALANNPDFILADEPTGNLDSKNELMIFEELKKLTQSGKGVLVVSHNDAVMDFADRICIMKDGVLEEK
ncbi:ABC transporter ATP-binding protein [uncultured Ruminococcus sp.]|uniref:ABC transporter ATP-binding protein n=1 Tax=uncultured Ruminococcus sp. TaxID=165186 RepID=UPI0025DD74E0|nr:ABC transporter ATP-binding protein [uncultured Ruminococcus sp.]